MTTDLYHRLLDPIPLPRMMPVEYHFHEQTACNPSAALKAQCVTKLDAQALEGARVAIAVGSRGITDIVPIVSALVEVLRDMHACPFIVPAMGSHGGATPEGQKDVLRHLGITEKAVGTKILASMDAVMVGYASRTIPVFCDRIAYEADAVILVNRIKPHTSFRGDYESGLAKMAVIGLGKQQGAQICHSTGLEHMSTRIASMAEVLLAKTPIIGGVAILENRYDETMEVEWVPAQALLKKEPILLKKAAEFMPSLELDECDVLVVDTIGKDISGTGMDPNIIKRFTAPHITCKPMAKTIVALDLSEKSDGNANGVGLADVITQRLFSKIHYERTYANPLTTRIPMTVKIPMVMSHDAWAIKAGVHCCFDLDERHIKIIRIRDTLHVDRIFVSEALQKALPPNASMIGPLEDWPFSESGNLF